MMNVLRRVRVLRDWNDFWFRPHSLVPAGLFRIALGLLILHKMQLLFAVVNDYYSETGAVTLAQSFRAVPSPRLCLFDYLPTNIAPLYFAVIILLAILFTFGCFTRVTTILLAIGLYSIENRDLMINNGGDRLMTLMLLFGMFAPLGAALSIDRLYQIYRGEATNQPSRGTYWVVRLMQFQFCTMYFWSSFLKLRGQSWPAGEAIYWVSRNIERARWPMPAPLYHSMGALNLLVYFTLLVEGLFPFLVWSKRSRDYVIAGAVLLHLSIEQSMTIQVFGPMVLVSLLLFYEGEEYLALWDRARKLLVKVQATPVFYDGDCGFCTRSVRVLEAMDILKRLELMNFRNPSVQKANPDLDLVRCERELVVRDAQGSWFGGFYAFRWMAWRLPPLWLLAPLAYIPGVPALGDRVYKWVANHRFMFPASDGAACALPTATPPDDRTASPASADHPAATKSEDEQSTLRR